MNRELETDGITITPETDVELAAADYRQRVSMWQKEVTKLRRELRQATAVVADQERINNELFDEKNRAVVERDALKAERDALRDACRTMYAYLSPEWDAAKADLYHLARSQGQTVSEYTFGELEKALAKAKGE